MSQTYHEAAAEILSLRAALAAANARAEAKSVCFKVETWDDGEVVITADGQPCGATLSRAAAREAVRWLGSAWADLIKANRLHTDRIESEAARAVKGASNDHPST